MPGIIAIVGRPNVGKSALFNRIAGRRIAIVHDQPGVTRDRVMAEVEWQGVPFTLVDTGGIGLLRGESAGDVITRAAVDQVQIAIESADLIFMVVNVREGIVPLDTEVAQRLRRSGKPVYIVVNKTDEPKAEAGAGEFSALGFDQIFPVSAIHGRGIAELMSTALKQLPPAPPASEPGDAQPLEVIRLAIVGRPNVGKSSIINTLTQSDRVIVSPIPGTTRDSVDVPFEVETEGVRQRYILIDTAGLRKARRVNDTVEFISTKRTEDSIARCDIAVLVLDAESGILEQDKKVADRIVECSKACIVVVNKWDLVEEGVRKAREEEIQRRNTRHMPEEDRDRKRRMSTLGEFGEWVQEKLFFLDYAPVIFTSARSGFNLERLLEAVRYVASQLKQTIPTAVLNRTLHDAIERRQPISATGMFLKFFYATQVKTVPPTFLLFVNRDEVFSPQYRKYLADQLRQAFGYEGCPIHLLPKPRPKSVESVRTARPKGSGPRRPKPGSGMKERRHGRNRTGKPRKS
ncbi:MAG TPA: ribosome biogenesis GTPase Der [Verrucomicrobiales bacterium]|nr:ribosome biogenesis GTPase Der [Verrucomicrobiales bacterium]